MYLVALEARQVGAPGGGPGGNSIKETSSQTASPTTETASPTPTHIPASHGSKIDLVIVRPTLFPALPRENSKKPQLTDITADNRSAGRTHCSDPRLRGPPPHTHPAPEPPLRPDTLPEESLAEMDAFAPPPQAAQQQRTPRAHIPHTRDRSPRSDGRGARGPTHERAVRHDAPRVPADGAHERAGSGP